MVMAASPLDVTVIFITTQTKWREETDVDLPPDRNNGIKKLSLLRTSKIATLDKSLVKGRLGLVNTTIREEIDAKIKIYLQLG